MGKQNVQAEKVYCSTVMVSFDRYGKIIHIYASILKKYVLVDYSYYHYF